MYCSPYPRLKFFSSLLFFSSQFLHSFPLTPSGSGCAHRFRLLSLSRTRALRFPYPSSMVTLASSDFKPSQALYHGIKDQSFTDFISYVFEEADPKSVPHFKSKGLSPILFVFPSLKYVVPIILYFFLIKSFRTFWSLAFVRSTHLFEFYNHRHLFKLVIDL